MSKLERTKESPNKLFITIPNAAERAGWSLRQFYRVYPGKIFMIGKCNYCLIPEVDEWAKNTPKSR